MARKGEKGIEYSLTIREQKFVALYIEYGDATRAVKEVGFRTTSPLAYARKILKKPKIQEELRKQMEDFKNEAIASANEILIFYTKAMRGEIKDQFGLDATLADKMKAADALAKRQIDMKAIADKAEDRKFTINLVWDRNNTPIDPALTALEDDEDIDNG